MKLKYLICIILALSVLFIFACGDDNDTDTSTETEDFDFSGIEINTDINGPILFDTEIILPEDEFE